MTAPIVETGLLIGGPADGRRVVVRHGNRISVPAPDANGSYLGSPPATYERVKLRGGGRDFHVWAPPELAREGQILMALLINGYRNP